MSSFFVKDIIILFFFFVVRLLRFKLEVELRWILLICKSEIIMLIIIICKKKIDFMLKKYLDNILKKKYLIEIYYV